MPLDFWIVLWKVVFIGSVVLFTVLTVVVTIGGARDIVKLLRILRAQQPDDGQHSD